MQGFQFKPQFKAVAACFPVQPTGIPYASRGECEDAYAHASKFDRERLTQLFNISPGEAQKTFRDPFCCEYDVTDDAWFIVFIG